VVTSGPHEQLHHPLEDERLQVLTNVAVRRRVVAAVDDGVAVRVDLDSFGLDQLQRLGRQRQQSRPLVRLEQRQGWLVGGPVLASPGSFADPASERFIGHPQIRELLAGQEAALQEMDSVFNLALVFGGPRPGRADHKPVVLGEPAVRLGQDRVVQRGHQHGRFQVVQNHLAWHAPETLEGTPVAGDPGVDPLVEDQLGVLVPTERQRHHERVGQAQLPSPGRAEVHLRQHDVGVPGGWRGRASGLKDT